MRRLIFGRAEGNPFFIAEYSRTAVSEGLVRRHRGSWVMDTHAQLSELPPTLRELIGRRLAGLTAIEMAVSSGVRAPLSRPTGALIRARAASAIPAARSSAIRFAWVRLLPIAPM